MSNDIQIAYQGPFFDYSGYGEANRQALAALHHSGVKVNAKALQYTSQSTDYGDIVNIVNQCLSNDFDYKIKIVHVTPDEIPRLAEKDKYLISHFFWETDRLPEVFVNGLNRANEIWTGSQANVDAIVNSGVTTPVFVFPQATNTSLIDFDEFDIGFDGFMFYSIFEWIDRKNPEALIRAYNKAFDGSEEVALVIKSYVKDFSKKSSAFIAAKVNDLQEECNSDNRIYIYHKLMTYKQIHGLHKRGNCYVSAHRGEGWGVPQAEALSHAKPVISTGYAGINEYLTSMVDGIVIPYQMVNLTGMDHSRRYYSFDQKWADIDIDILAEKMRFVYENRKEAKKIGKNGQELAKTKFSYEAVGNLMKNRIIEILG